MASTQSLLLAFFGVVALVEGRVFPQHGDNKIINGYRIDISKVPWQVSLLANNEHTCGGSIIGTQWVLSAARCTFRYQASQLQIRIGSNSSIEGGTLYEVEKVVNHEGFNSEILNDITLLKSATDMRLEHPVKAVRLPNRWAKRPPGKTKLQVSGWGFTGIMEPDYLLQAVVVEVCEFEECKDYADSYADEATQICAGSYGKGVCIGDTGGPLVKGEILVGVVLYSFALCGSLPGVYTDVAVYRQWIKKHTGL